MRRNLIISILMVTSLMGHAQAPADTIRWERMLYAYVDALKADVQYNNNLRVSNMIERWKQPLNNVYDEESVACVRDSIKIFLNDSLSNYSKQYREQAQSIARLLDIYGNEAQRMIAAFDITDPQMLGNLKYCDSAPFVQSFSQMFLCKWFETSQLSSFLKSEIPFLSSTANKLKRIIESLCDKKTATPDLLQQFFDTEYHISTIHTKENTTK